MRRASERIFGVVFERENMLSVSVRKYEEEEHYENNITYHGRRNRQPFRNRNQAVGAGRCFESYHHGLFNP